jgi:transcriptional regulator with XRE-family HTH domain
VQKYERGANRISASKLYETASALQVPVAYFFEGLADPSEGGSETQDHAAVAINAFLNTAEGLELARSFLDIGPGRLRRQVLELVRALAVAPD